MVQQELEPESNRLEVFLRILTTGFCFLTFGVVTLTVGSVLFTLMMLKHRTRDGRLGASRSIVRWWFSTFVEIMRLLGVLDYEIHGAEKLQRPGLLILANHPSLIDVVIIGSLVPRFCAVVRSNLMKNPVIRVAIEGAGYITNDQGLGLVHDSERALTLGDDIVIFPQGTRTPENGDIKLQRGAANIAIRNRRPVTPVVITCQPRGLARYQRWYQVPPRRMHFVIRVHDDLQVDKFLEAGVPEALAVRRLNAHLEAFFEQESRRATP